MYGSRSLGVNKRERRWETSEPPSRALSDSSRTAMPKAAPGCDGREFGVQPGRCARIVSELVFQDGQCRPRWLNVGVRDCPRFASKLVVDCPQLDGGVAAKGSKQVISP